MTFVFNPIDSAGVASVGDGRMAFSSISQFESSDLSSSNMDVYLDISIIGGSGRVSTFNTIF